jgi:hypothetical protein
MSPQGRALARLPGLLICRQNFHLSPPVTSMTRRRGRQVESPLATAFKISDDDEDERPRYKPNSPDVPPLMGLSKRWNKMDALDQEEVIIYLDDKCRDDWKTLTTEEKQASKCNEPKVGQNVKESEVTNVHMRSMVCEFRSLGPQIIST